MLLVLKAENKVILIVLVQISLQCIEKHFKRLILTIKVSQRDSRCQGKNVHHANTQTSHRDQLQLLCSSTLEEKLLSCTSVEKRAFLQAA
jgi:hypothetical protein